MASAVLSDRLPTDLADRICARVHRLNFAPVLEDVRSVFERVLRKGGDPVERLRRTHDVSHTYSMFRFGSSQLVLVGQRFLLMRNEYPEGYIGLEAFYEGFQEGGKIKIERACMILYSRSDPDVKLDSMHEIMASGVGFDFQGQWSDPGQRLGLGGSFKDVIDTSYRSGKTWHDLTQLQRWYYPPTTYYRERTEEHCRTVYTNARARLNAEHEESVRRRRRARRDVEEERRRRRRAGDEEEDDEDEVREQADMALAEDEEILRSHLAAHHRLRMDCIAKVDEIVTWREAAVSEAIREYSLLTDAEKRRERRGAERSSIRADRATTWRRG